MHRQGIHRLFSKQSTTKMLIRSSRGCEAKIMVRIFLNIECVQGHRRPARVHFVVHEVWVWTKLLRHALARRTQVLRKIVCPLAPGQSTIITHFQDHVRFSIAHYAVSQRILEATSQQGGHFVCAWSVECHIHEKWGLLTAKGPD